MTAENVNEPRSYRKKPVVVTAMRVPKHWDGNGVLYEIGAISVFLGARGPWRWVGDGSIEIETLEGKMLAKPGDWVIRGIKGEFYPCKPAIFEATYEPA